MDNSVTVGVHQPNFMPWLGYFSKIAQSDVFIFLDDAQYPKTTGTYLNSVNFLMNSTSTPLILPIKKIKGRYWNINETIIADGVKNKKKVIGKLQGNYAKAKYFKEHKAFIFDLIEFPSDNLSEYNMHFITRILAELNINTKIVKSSEFKLTSTSTQRLIDLIQLVNGNSYLSGKGGDNYQDHQLYEDANIQLQYNQLPKFEYEQYRSTEFIGGLSIVDAIFNIGIKRLREELFSQKREEV